jgi:hypothetical protein
MAKSKKEPAPEQLNGLRRQIHEWRQNRTVPGAMPIVLWDQAVTLAKDFGVCRIARAVGLDYRRHDPELIPLPNGFCPA